MQRSSWERQMEVYRWAAVLPVLDSDAASPSCWVAAFCFSPHQDDASWAAFRADEAGQMRSGETKPAEHLVKESLGCSVEPYLVSPPAVERENQPDMERLLIKKGLMILSSLCDYFNQSDVLCFILKHVSFQDFIFSWPWELACSESSLFAFSRFLKWEGLTAAAEVTKLTAICCQSLKNRKVYIEETHELYDQL